MSDAAFSVEEELLDLKITNRAKDFYIKQLKEEREGFVAERQEYVTQLISANRRMGELETHLQLTEPSKVQKVEVRADSFVSGIETTEM